MSLDRKGVGEYLQRPLISQARRESATSFGGGW